MLCALLLLGATSATSSLACRSTTDSSTTVQCAELPNADGEGCNYFTCMGWDCTSCANCAGGWIADPTQCGAAADTAAPPDESGCTESRCSSPDGQGGYDCYAPASRGEECSCTQGSARVLSVFDWEDTQLYHYSCCDSGPTDGPSCGYTSPPSPLVPLLIVAGVLYIVSMTFVYCWYAKAKARAQGVPTSGYCSTPPNAVDVSADSLDVSAGFRAMGRREVMPQALEPHMSRDEYALLFQSLTRQLHEELSFHAWHLLLWVPMIAFWAAGGFFIMLWGIWRARWASIAIVGEVVGPACDKAGIRYVFIPTGGHRRNPPIVRFLLDGTAGGTMCAQPTSTVPMAMAVPMPLGQGVQVVPMDDAASRILRLKDLLDAGAISQAEFDQKKAELLASF